MLKNFIDFKIKNTKVIYGGTGQNDGEPIESVSLSYSEIPVTYKKSKSSKK